MFLIHLFVVYYTLICISLFACLYSCKALLTLILAPTCKTDYLVLICCFHRKLKFKEFSRNTIDLHFLNIFLFLWTTVSLLIYTNNYVKDGTHLFVNLVLVLTRKAALFELDQSLGFAALTLSLGSSSNKISYFVRTCSN